MESVFLRFNSYDFEADTRFQDGLKTLHENSSRDENKVLDMKLFFYNRFVEPIDRTGYKQWSSSRARVMQLEGEQRDQRPLPDSDCDIRNRQTPDTSAETEATQLSLAEVMRLVQEGKEVPGVTKLDVKPTNQSPTASQMERILKPWEIPSVSK